MERQAEKWMNLCLSVPDFRDLRQFWGTSDRFRGISLPVGLGGGINKTILTKKETPPKGCSQNIEAAGTPSPILLSQAAALQKPTGLFADRLRP